MSSGVQGFVRRWWDGEAGALGALASALALPLEWAYRFELGRRSRRIQRGGAVRVPGLTVVSVGNLTVGGTGKTPVAAWFARQLADTGAPTALLARGYGSDEVELHRRWNPDVPVVVGADRVSGARRAREEGARFAVLDDGFQHRRLARDLDVVLLAAEDPFPGPLLPRGPFREGPDALARADLVVVTRRTAGRDQARALADTVRLRWSVACAELLLEPSGWEDLSGMATVAPEGPVMAVAAVARPEAFRRNVASVVGSEVELMAFRDHHDFTAAEVKAMRRRAGRRTVVVTQKDAVKLHAHAAALEPVRVLTQTLRWEQGLDVLDEKMAALIVGTP